MQLESDAIIASRYQLDRRIGEGGMGVVWAATHVVTRRSVALKFLKGSSPEHTKRFLREARIAGMLGHPHIVQVHDVLELPEDGTPTMVMELLSGESLDARLERVGAIALPELVALMLPVVSAVGAAHEIGVVHRDLKPDNIFLATGPHAPLDVKVLDFGIAKLTATEGDAASTSGLTQTGAVMGTPYYMAPEQVFGESKIDARADVWSLGVILYECLSGKRPIEGENFGQIFKNIAMGDVVPVERLVPSVPLPIASLIGRMLSRDKEKRPSDMREVYAELTRHRNAPSEPPPFGEPRLGEASPIDVGSVALRREAGDSIGAAAVTAGRGGPSKGTWIGIAAAALIALSGGTWRYTHATPAAEATAALTAGAVVVAPPTDPPSAGSPPASPPAASPAPATGPTVGSTPSPSPASAQGAAPSTPQAASEPAKAPAVQHASTKAAARPAKKPLPGGIHGDSPY